MPRSRSASATRRARFSSIGPKYVPPATARARSPGCPDAIVLLPERESRVCRPSFAGPAGARSGALAGPPMRDQLGWPGSLAARRMRAEEADDHFPEPLTLVLLQEMPGARDHRVLPAGRTGDGAFQDGGHACRNRVAVAEGDEERLVPGGQPLPRRAVGRRRRVAG